LYNILIEFGVSKKLVRLIKICLTETYSRVRVGKNLSDMFPIRIDVMLMSETHFTSRSHFKISGYNTCVTNHPADRAHGGTAILIKSQIPYAVLPGYASPELHATIINVRGPHRSITLASTYCPPKYNLKAPLFENTSYP